jgi:hypothetical protein
METKINLADALATFDEAFRPRVVGTMNDLKLMVVKIRGALSGMRIPRPTTSS